MNRPIRETEFFTTSELAEKLKMNVQVITRKVKAGEIYAYKIGKDWRIPDSSVREWLDKQANNGLTFDPGQSATSPNSKKSQRTEHRHLLEYILAQLEPDRSYSEQELQKIVSRQYKNWKEIYNELLTAGMVEKDSAGIRRREGYTLLSETA
jgi:excisionase family DNA binding protein